MTNSSPFEEVASAKKISAVRALDGGQSGELPNLLILDNDLAVLSYRSTLLTSRYPVTTARDQADLYDLRCRTVISVAIISDSLGAASLAAAARSVRMHWPSARILILGRAQMVLEDYLYDEALERPFLDSDLLETIGRVCHRSANLQRDKGLFIVDGAREAKDPDSVVNAVLRRY